jgi:phosphoenolpyruvate carboxylase
MATNFWQDLQLIQRNLEATGLNCQDLDTLICQVEIFGFNLAQLDFRQESSVHSDALDEVTQYLQVLPQPYSEMPEADKTAWLVSELKTRRPLIPGELPFSDKTRETIATLRIIRKLHQEFGPDICFQLCDQHEPPCQRHVGGVVAGQRGWPL